MGVAFYSSNKFNMIPKVIAFCLVVAAVEASSYDGYGHHYPSYGYGGYGYGGYGYGGYGHDHHHGSGYGSYGHDHHGSGYGSYGNDHHHGSGYGSHGHSKDKRSTDSHVHVSGNAGP